MKKTKHKKTIKSGNLELILLKMGKTGQIFSRKNYKAKTSFSEISAVQVFSHMIYYCFVARLLEVQ